MNDTTNANIMYLTPKEKAKRAVSPVPSGAKKQKSKRRRRRLYYLLN